MKDDLYFFTISSISLNCLNEGFDKYFPYDQKLKPHGILRQGLGLELLLKDLMRSRMEYNL